MEIDETKALCARVGKTPPAFFDKLSEKLENVFEELKLVYTNPTPRLRKLFLIKTLSSLLTGQIDGSLTTYSLLDVSNLKGQLSKEIAYRQKISSFKQTPHFSEFLPLGEYVGSKEMENTWENFLISLEKLPLSQTIIKDRSSLQELFSSLRQLSPSEHFIGAFLNFICLPQILQNNKADTTLHNLAALSIKDLPLFQDLVIKNKQIAEIKQRLYAFQDPQALPTIRKELLNLHSFFSNENSFLTPTRTGNSLIKLISAEILKELVETTDLAIKSLKVSAHLSNREKIIQMELILRSNFTMLFTWFRKLIPDAERGIFFQNDSFKSYNGYENFIQNAWSRLYNRNTPEQNLQPSPNFSVGAAVINAFTNYNRHTPQTLEDIFTLLHQNQIIAVSTFAFKEQKLTALPNSLQSAMKTVKDKIPKASLQGAEISPKGIRLQYNIPLQNHSAGFEIEYIKETDSFLIHGKLFGESRQRWPACSEYLQALHSAGGLSLAKAPQLTSQELLFTWKLTDDDDLSSAIDQFNQFLDYSFTPDKQSIFNKIKNYLSSKPSLLAGVGKWFYEHNINAPSLVNSYLATI
jgi:hypothetical protein